MSPSEKAELFAAWQEQRLTDEQRSTFESLCREDEDFAQALRLNKSVELLAAEYQDDAIPEWSRHQEHFDAQHAQQQFGTPQAWMPIAAFAMSLLAMLMVVSDFQIRLSDGQLHAGFGGLGTGVNQGNLAAELKTIQETERQWYVEQINQLRKEQRQANMELTSYMLESNRRAQQDGFSQMVQLLNAQRREDQLYYTDQLKRVQSVLERQEIRAWNAYQTADDIH